MPSVPHHVMRVYQLTINTQAPTTKTVWLLLRCRPCAPLQEALKDAEGAQKERSALVARVKQLQQRLEEEQASRSQLKERVQRKLAEAEQEVGWGGAGWGMWVRAGRLRFLVWNSMAG